MIDASASSPGLAAEVAFVTGATRGIGRAIDLALAHAGADVIGTATSEEGAASISAFLKEANVRGEGVRLDVRDRSATETALRDAESRHGPITVLVNNAGITRDNLLVRMKDDDWDAVMA